MRSLCHLFLCLMPFVLGCGIARYQPLGFGLSSLNSTMRLRVEDSLLEFGAGNAIYSWNGVSFKALTPPLPTQVVDFAKIDGKICAVGSFQNAGGVADADYLACWDGTSWSTIGGPKIAASGGLNRVLSFGGTLWVGGTATSFNGLTGQLLNWDGSTWSDLSAAINSDVSSLVEYQGLLYVAGNFTNAGGVGGATGIASWDGATWAAVGAWSTNPVQIKVIGSTLYAFGNFTAGAGVVGADYVAAWDGAIWSVVGAGLTGTVNSIAQYQSNLCVAGNFADAGGNGNADNLACWDGASWLDLGGPITGTVDQIEVYKGELCALGSGMLAINGDTALAQAACWNGTRWRRMDTSLAPVVASQKIEIFQGQTYVDVPGSAPYLGRYNGTAYSQPWAQLDGAVGAIFAGNGKLYVGGQFTSIDGVPTPGQLGVYDGSSWSVLSSDAVTGGDNIQSGYVASDGSIYVGGTFSFPLIANTNSIAKWDGATWGPVGVGVTVGGTVNAIAQCGQNIWIGGTFADASGVANTVNIAYWDGAQWNAASTGLNNTVYDIVEYRGSCYAAGDFTGTTGGDYLAKWNGSTWQGVAGLNAGVRSLQVANGELYACGIFTAAGSTTPTSAIASWNGGRWKGISELGVGTGGTCSDIALDSANNALLFAGSFGQVSAKVVSSAFRLFFGIAEYASPSGFVSPYINSLSRSSLW